MHQSFTVDAAVGWVDLFRFFFDKDTVFFKKFIIFFFSLYSGKWYTVEAA